MTNELKGVLLDIVEGLKNEIDEINEEINRLTYRSGITNNVKELDIINSQLEGLNDELKEDLKEMKSLIKKINKASK